MAVVCRWVGVDVSKEWLDACFVRANGKNVLKKYVLKRFSNAPAGWAKLLRWAQSLGSEAVRFCLESTGSYSEGLALHLAEAGEVVSVVNPARVKYFGMGKGFLNKNDKADARVIALFAVQEDPEPWRLSKPEVRHLVSLLRRLHALEQHLQQERNRLSEPNLLPEVARSIQDLIHFLEAEMKRLEEQARGHVDQHPGLKADKELLLSIDGVGETTAHWLLAELPDVRQFDSAKSAAAYAGLSPVEHTSGKSVKKRTRISKAGNRYLRRALYMPALSAVRFNAPVADLYRRLLQRGLCKKAALVAAMRKLLMIAYGVLKSQQKFTPKPAGNAA
jgi:transposase